MIDTAVISNRCLSSTITELAARYGGDRDTLLVLAMAAHAMESLVMRQRPDVVVAYRHFERVFRRSGCYDEADAMRQYGDLQESEGTHRPPDSRIAVCSMARDGGDNWDPFSRFDGAGFRK